MIYWLDLARVHTAFMSIPYPFVVSNHERNVDGTPDFCCSAEAERWKRTAPNATRTRKTPERGRQTRCSVIWDVVGDERWCQWRFPRNISGVARTHSRSRHWACARQRLSAEFFPTFWAGHCQSVGRNFCFSLAGEGEAGEFPAHLKKVALAPTARIKSSSEWKSQKKKRRGPISWKCLTSLKTGTRNFP